MADLKKKSTLRILKTDVVGLIQQHYPNLYSKLSSITIIDLRTSPDGLYLEIEFLDASDGSQLV